MSPKKTFNKVSIAAVGLFFVMASKTATEMDVETVKIDPSNSNEIIQKKSEPVIPQPLAIFFGINEDNIPETSDQQIKDIAQYLIASGDTFEIEGCSSPDGNDGNNFMLATRRAQSVLNALEQKGVPITRYHQGIDGAGQDRDIYGTSEDECTPLDGAINTTENTRRASHFLNPVYEQPEQSNAPPINLFDFLKSQLSSDPEI